MVEIFICTFIQEVWEFCIYLTGIQRISIIMEYRQKNCEKNGLPPVTDSQVVFLTTSHDTYMYIFIHIWYMNFIGTSNKSMMSWIIWGGQQCVMTANSGSIVRPFGHEEITFQKTKIIRAMNCSRQTDCFSLGQYL